MTAKKIRFGFIGAGQIAYSSADSVRAHPQGEVVAIQDTNADRLADLGRKAGIPKTYAEAQQLFTDPDVDAVYIAVPNKFHAPLALDALRAGKHVLLEKPFAFNYADAKEVVDTAAASGRVFSLGMNMRFRPDSQIVREMVRDGTLGEVYHAKAFWFRRQGIPKLGTWFGRRELSGGGCLYDIGVHMLDLCLFTMGNYEPVSVTGATYTKFGNRGLGEGGWGMSDREHAHADFDVEDFATGLIKFANGATVSLDVSWACHAEDSNRNDVHLYGTDAGAQCFPAKLFRSADQGPGYIVEENLKRDLSFAPDRFHNFINHLLGGEELCVTPHHALVVQRILDAVQESCRSGREVRLDA